MALGTLTRRCGGALVALLAMATCAGCGQSTADDTGASAPMIPGGAALTPEPGAPRICGRLSGADELRGLGDAITGWTQSPPAPDAADDVRAAGQRMRDLAGDAGAGLAPVLRATGRRLQQVAHRGGNRRSTETLAAAMRRLGRALEKPCGYPVG